VAHLVPPERAAGRCPACFGAELAPQPARLRAEPPELAAPFRVTPAQAQAALDQWARSVWLRPPDLTGQALASRLTATFVPLWLVDAEAAGSWAAQAGYDYQVASTQESYLNGNWQTQRLTETRIRWEPRAGEVVRAYANVAVPALEEHARLTAGAGAWETQAAEPYAPGRLEGAAVRVPSLEPDAAWPQARARLDERVVADCQQAAGAQHMEQARLAVTYARLNWTQMLLPLYTTAYQDDEGTWRPVLINGQTGRVSGVKRASQRLAWMWTGGLAAAAVGLLLLSLLLGLAGAVLPPILAVSALLLVASIGVALVAPVPAVWAWRFNQGGK
jgi:hypothetical protein